jgi:hypothetical protein
VLKREAVKIKIPRALSMVLLAGCGAGGAGDGGTPDAATIADAGADGGRSDACTLNLSCDAGAGMPQGYCVQLTSDDGGHYASCELLFG